jgi:hypothetical protein
VRIVDGCDAAVISTVIVLIFKALLCTVREVKGIKNLLHVIMITQQLNHANMITL